MKAKRTLSLMILGAVAAVSLAGCHSLETRGDPSGGETVEAQWIRDGQPIVFEGASWYPQDDVENLLDFELTSLGAYQGVDFFIERTDVRPFNRLYTKFGKNKYRLFEKKMSP